MHWLLIVFMAGAQYSSTLTIHELSSKEACAVAKEWVDRNSGNVRQSACVEVPVAK